jgi:hypothetical protein
MSDACALKNGLITISIPVDDPSPISGIVGFLLSGFANTVDNCATMKLTRTKALLALLLASAMLACGSPPDLPRSSEVTVSITPPAALIRVGESVDLVGAVTGLSKPTLDWWMQDHHDAKGINGAADCDHITTVNSDLIAGCTFGYLTGSGMIEAASANATYHAPMTPGIYHVTLRASQMSAVTLAEFVEKRTTAIITVVP